MHPIPLIAGLGLLLAAGPASLAAETFRHGGATTSIEQQGGTRPSQSQVTRDANGQRIVTTDGRNTDVTIQHGDGAAVTTSRFAGPSRPDPWDEAADWPWRGDGTREAFRQRMLERLERWPEY